MRHSLLATALVFAGLTAVVMSPSSTTVYAQSPPSATELAGVSANSAIEVLTRGPVHEAFAQPVNSGGDSPLVVPKRPPGPIEEVPPNAKPADESATWIAGYWTWNDDAGDFDWTSGVWRIPPPGQRWITGYWAAVPAGYSWVPGFWTSDEQDEIVYYPRPPASLEQGPTAGQSTANDVWISGCWRWADSRFVWRAGYWTEGQTDWVWVAASYYWSPRGWLFCNGYWDHPLEQRGLLFAPVRFADAVYRQPGFFYTPSVVIDPSLLTFYLFARPNYSHYYFGDYYAANYDRLGIYPWFAVRGHPSYAYDPLLTYYRWRNRTRNPDWERNVGSWYAYYREHPELRLPHNLAAAQRAVATAGERPDRQFLKIADTLPNWRSSRNADIRIATLPREQVTQFRQSARLMRQFENDRRRLEAVRTVGTATGREVLSAPNATRRLDTPETVQFPRIARTLTERAPSRLDGTTRQAMKAVVPPIPTNRSDEMRGNTEKPKGPSVTPGVNVVPKTKERTFEKAPPKDTQRPVGPAAIPGVEGVPKGS